jgi:hypothetical protein
VFGDDMTGELAQWATLGSPSGYLVSFLWCDFPDYPGFLEIMDIVELRAHTVPQAYHNRPLFTS